VHGNLYGTPSEPIDRALAADRWALLDIDVQGAEQLRDKAVEGTYVMIRPPSLEALRERLEGRGTESPEELEQRLSVAAAELARADLFDHLVTNDDLERATAEVAHLIGLRDAHGADGCGG